MTNGPDECPTCGAPAVLGAAACASCGRVATVKPGVSSRVVLGLASGVVVGFVLIIPLFFGSANFANTRSSLPIVLTGEGALLIAAIACAAWFFNRRKPAWGAFVLSAALVAFLPVMACDAILGGIR